MKVIARTGACVLALVAIGGTAASSALGAPVLPEFGKCNKVATGTGVYRGSNCVVRETGVSGKYEWAPVTLTEKLAFGGAGGETTLASTGHGSVKCIGANFSGEYTGGKTVSVTIEFQGCLNDKGAQCQSGTTKSEIKTLPLEGEVGFIRNEEVEGKAIIIAGLDLKPTSPLTALAIYECGGTLESNKLEGSVIAKVRPINKPNTTWLGVYAVNKMTHQQIPESFQGGAKDTLSTTFMTGLESTTAPSTLSIIKTVGLTNATPVEIKAREK